jgi:hypothetical protein
MTTAVADTPLWDAELDTPIWGAEAIGAAIGRSGRQTVYMLEAGHLPASKAGRLWVTTKRRLRTIGEQARDRCSPEKRRGLPAVIAVQTPGSRSVCRRGRISSF